MAFRIGITAVIVPAVHRIVSHQPVEDSHDHDPKPAAEDHDPEPSGNVGSVGIAPVDAATGHKIAHNAANHDEHHSLKKSEEAARPLGFTGVVVRVGAAIVTVDMFMLMLVIVIVLLSRSRSRSTSRSM